MRNQPFLADTPLALLCPSASLTFCHCSPAPESDWASDCSPVEGELPGDTPVLSILSFTFPFIWVRMQAGQISFPPSGVPVCGGWLNTHTKMRALLTQNLRIK